MYHTNEELRELYWPFLISRAQYWYHKHRTMLRGGLSINDLAQEGYLGLMSANEKFDPDKGVKFLTYATWKVNSSMQTCIREFCGAASGTRKSSVFSQTLGASTKLADQLYRSIAAVPSAGDVEDKSPTTCRATEAGNLLHEIREYLKEVLGPRNFQILDLYYFNGKTQREVAAIMGLSHQQVCNITRAGRKMIVAQFQDAFFQLQQPT